MASAWPTRHPPVERPHPLERLSWAERARWAGARRKAGRAVDALQLRLLTGLAAGQPVVQSMWSAEQPGRLRAIELTVGERRLAGRVSVDVEATLAEAVAAGPIRLVDVGRYGPYWTLTFGAARELLVVLADQLVLWPAAGGTPDEARRPALRAGD